MGTHNGTTPESNPNSPAPAPAPGGGPIVAIVLGVIIIIAAVVLVMTVGQKDLEANEPKEDRPAGTEPVAVSSKAEKAGDAEEKEPIAAADKPQAAKADGESATPPADDPASHLKAAKEYADKTVGSTKAPEGTEALAVELPNPAFAGTPKAIPAGARMKELTGKERGAYFLPAELAESLTNVAYEKPVTSSDPAPLIGDLEQVTDGDKEPLDGRWVELAPGKQWVQIDLGQPYEAFAINIWHNHMEARIYKDVVVQVSDEPDFVSPITVFNNDFDNSSGFGQGEDYEYFENYEGLLVPLYDPRTGNGLSFRYVRVWSRGSTSDDANHYTEVEVWAREPK